MSHPSTWSSVAVAALPDGGLVTFVDTDGVTKTTPMTDFKRRLLLTTNIAWMTGGLSNVDSLASGDFFLVWDASENKFVTLTRNALLNHLLGTEDLSWMTPLAASDLDLVTDELIVADSSASGKKLKRMLSRDFMNRITGVTLPITSFGAVPCASLTDVGADIKQAIRDAATAGGAHCTITIPPGVWRLTGSPSDYVRFASSGIRLRGAGRNETWIQLDPTADNARFLEWSSVATYTTSQTQLNYCSIEGLSFYSMNTTYTKKIVRTINVSNFHALDIMCRGPEPLGADYLMRGGNSVLFYCRGREQNLWRGIQCYGIQALILGKNPNTIFGNYDVDQFVVEDFFNEVPAATKALMTHTPCNIRIGNVTGDSDDDQGDVRISTLKFSGHQSWLGGDHGLYWKANALLAQGGEILIENLVDEQALTTGGHTVHIEIEDTRTGPANNERLRSVKIVDTSPDVTRSGFYFKNVERIKMEGGSLPQEVRAGFTATGATDLAPQMISFKDIAYPAAPYSGLISIPANMVLSNASQVPYGDTRMWPHTATWTLAYAADGVSQRPFWRSGAVDHWNRYGTLADGATWILPITERYQGAQIALVEITAVSDSAAGTTCLSGSFAVAPNAMGTNGVVKISGPANLVVGYPASGQLGLVGVTGTTELDYCALVSDANETLRVMVIVREVRNQWN